MAIDYVKKAQCLKLGIPRKLNYISKQDYLFYADGIVPSVSVEQMYTDMLFEHGLDMIREGKKINNAYYKRVSRLRKRIMKYLKSGEAVFVTITFNDDVLDSTSEKTRRKYVSRYLKSKAQQYVANIDYGVDDRYTHREHYHAVVLTPFVENTWKYGHCWHEKVIKTDSEKLLSKYISKLTNHAIKDSTKRCVYIYSRKV